MEEADRDVAGRGWGVAGSAGGLDVVAVLIGGDDLGAEDRAPNRWTCPRSTPRSASTRSSDVLGATDPEPTTTAPPGPLTSEDIPDSVLEQSQELDVEELATALLDQGRTFTVTEPVPTDTDWREAVAQAMNFEFGATFEQTWIVRGTLTTLDPSLPPDDVWLVVLRGLTISSSGPAMPGTSVPRGQTTSRSSSSTPPPAPCSAPSLSADR